MYLRIWVGVDVSKAELVCRILDEKERELGQETFHNGSAGFRKFKKFLLSLDSEGCFFVSMEATGVYYRNFARFIFNSNDRFVPGVLNPASVKAFAQSRLSRTKTDGQDALIIARYALDLFRDDAFRPREPERAEVARREQLLETRTAAQNRLQALKEDGDSLDFVIESVEKEYAHLDEQVREIDRKISVHMDRHEGLKKDKELLTSIPGIGIGTTTTAASWLAHLGNLSRFDKPSRIVGHIGIAPRERQSGSSVRGRPQICRTGIKELPRPSTFPSSSPPPAAIRP
jgi:transposase